MNQVSPILKNKFSMMEQFTKDKSRGFTDMVTEFKFGPTVLSMRATGEIMSPMEEANFSILMVMFMMVKI
jgi:hypothetical protein